MFCSRCGTWTPQGTAFWASCGAPASPAGAQTPGQADAFAQPSPLPPPAQAVDAPKSKMVAALLGIFVGAFGILTCGITTLASAVWGLTEGIMILTGNINKDAAGRPLVE